MHNVCNECIKNLLPVSASVSLLGVAHRNCKSLQAGFCGPHYLGELHAGTRTSQTGGQLQYVSYGVSGLTSFRVYILSHSQRWTSLPLLASPHHLNMPPTLKDSRYFLPKWVWNVPNCCDCLIRIINNIHNNAQYLLDILAYCKILCIRYLCMRWILFYFIEKRAEAQRMQFTHSVHSK